MGARPEARNRFPDMQRAIERKGGERGRNWLGVRRDRVEGTDR